MSNPQNTFYGECRPFDGAVIEDQALAVNGFTREEIASRTKPECELYREFMDWTQAVIKHKPIMIGQNVTFDRDFLIAAGERCGRRSPYNFRVVDLHSVGWFYISERGSRPPLNLTLNKLLEMTGAGREPDPHNALTGAMCAAEVISRMLNGKSLFPETFNQ
jgi:DNA polymerase-3 subunit epsilon